MRGGELKGRDGTGRRGGEGRWGRGGGKGREGTGRSGGEGPPNILPKSAPMTGKRIKLDKVTFKTFQLLIYHYKFYRGVVSVW
jgi:hypothetical protein